jgi:hypothetical protein
MPFLLNELRTNPEPHDSQKLKGYDVYRRADVGEYRIVYFVRESVVLIIVLVGKQSFQHLTDSFFLIRASQGLEIRNITPNTPGLRL